MNALAQWMAANGVRDESLAAQVGVSRVQISRIRRGINRPSLDLALQLEPMTGVPAIELMTATPPATGRAA